MTAELWLNANAHNIFDNKQLGMFLGELLDKDFAPLKRLTDLINHSLINIDKNTNQALFTFLKSLVSNIKNSTPKNCKRLLEIIFELKHKSEEVAFTPEFKTALNSWTVPKSTEAIVKRIMES